MDCKAQSVFLLIAFLLMTFGSVMPCTYQQFNCGVNNTIELDELSDDGNFSCIEWIGADEKCLLFIKRKRDDGITNFILSESHGDVEFTIGHGEIANDTFVLETVTNSTGWGKKGVLYKFKSIWIEWWATVDFKIKAQFQDLIFKQYPVTLHKEDDGTFHFPNASCNYTYRPNSAFIWMLSTDAHCEKACNETKMDIVLKKVSPIDSGDALILGMGNKTQMFQGPKSLLLPGNITEPLNIHLTLGEAFVILLTGQGHTESNINFEVHWKRISTKPENTTIEITTAMPDAWMQSVTICINRISKDMFNQNRTVFKDIVAKMANEFARDKNKDLASYRIRPEVVEISDTHFFELGKNENVSDGVQIVLTIVEEHDRARAVFRARDLQDMFRNRSYVHHLHTADFDVPLKGCTTTPDYVDWFWASCITFIFSIAILLIVWYIKSKNIFGNERDDEDKVLLKDNVQQRTMGRPNEYEQGYFTRKTLQYLTKDQVNENSVQHTEINTEDHVATRAKTRVVKHNSDVGARRYLPKSNDTRPTSDPHIRLHEINTTSSVESPKSILRKEVKDDVLNSAAITEESQEYVADHLYDTVGSQKMLIINDENSEPEQYVNVVNIEDEIEDTRC